MIKSTCIKLTKLKIVIGTTCYTYLSRYDTKDALVIRNTDYETKVKTSLKGPSTSVPYNRDHFVVSEQFRTKNSFIFVYCNRFVITKLFVHLEVLLIVV